MDQYAGLDMAVKETSIPVRQNRKRIWRGKCLPDPQLVAEMIRKHAPYAGLAVFETGPPTWFHRKPADGLKAAGIDKACEGGTRYGVAAQYQRVGACRNRKSRATFLRTCSMTATSRSAAANASARGFTKRRYWCRPGSDRRARCDGA